MSVGIAAVFLVPLAALVIAWHGHAPASAEGRQHDLSAEAMVERLRLPADEHDAIPGSSGVSAYVDVDSARLLTEDPQARFFVAVGRQGGAVCVLGFVGAVAPTREHAEDAAVTCSEPRTFAVRGAYLAMGTVEEHHAVLVLPDSVGSVDVAGHESAVTGNHIRFGPFAFSADPMDDGAAVEYAEVRLGPAGSDGIVVPVPLDAARSAIRSGK